MFGFIINAVKPSHLVGEEIHRNQCFLEANFNITFASGLACTKHLVLFLHFPLYASSPAALPSYHTMQTAGIMCFLEGSFTHFFSSETYMRPRCTKAFRLLWEAQACKTPSDPDYNPLNSSSLLFEKQLKARSSQETSEFWFGAHSEVSLNHILAATSSPLSWVPSGST